MGGKEGMRDAGLEAKVQTFLDDVTQFTHARRQDVSGRGWGV